jgi:uncharacterized membrane protein
MSNFRKKKLRQAKKKQVRDVIWLIIAGIAGLVMAWYLSGWIRTLTWSHQQPRTGQVDFSNGLWNLIFYMICLLGLIAIGFFLAKKMEVKY